MKLRTEFRQLYAEFDQFSSEYDSISTMYQDQMRTNQEEEYHITFIEIVLKKFGYLNPSAALVPFYVPVSQINFVNPPRRVRSAVETSSPPSQMRLV